MTRAALIALALLAAGCSTPSWLPWSAGHKANAAEKAEAKRDEAKDKLVSAAQRTAHETQIALVSAPTSRPVEIAREATQATVTALDQAAGPLTVEEAAKIRQQVANLLSENAKLREMGEKERAEARGELADLSARLASTQAKLDAANGALPAALRREAELADRYRFLRNITLAAGAIGILGYLGMLYLRVTYGGIPAAIGAGLAELRVKHPDAGNAATSIFDAYLSRREQNTIRSHT